MGVRGFGFGFGVWGFRVFRVWGVGIQGLGIQGLGIQGLGFGVLGSERRYTGFIRGYIGEYRGDLGIHGIVSKEYLGMYLFDWAYAKAYTDLHPKRCASFLMACILLFLIMGLNPKPQSPKNYVSYSLNS